MIVDTGERQDPIVVDETDDDEDDPIDDDQLNEYREMVSNLGVFPDKVKINSLSMVAEDHAESKKNASAIYNVIRESLISKMVSIDRKLPLVYLIDSILKNVKGKYIPVIEADARNWLPVVYHTLPEDGRAKLKKVYNLWKDAGIFSEANWKLMGTCFTTTAVSSSTSSTDNHPEATLQLEKAGITYGKDGNLMLMPRLREFMQTLLDDIQSDIQNELDKVSLERLAVIDPDLLIKIKRTAEDSLRHGGGGTTSTMEHFSNKSSPLLVEEKPSFLEDLRSPEFQQRSLTWEKVKIDYMKESHDLITALRHVVMEVSKSDETYTQREAIDMTNTLGAAGAMAAILTSTLERIRDNDRKTTKASIASGNKANASGHAARGFFTIDKSLFTNEGLKKKNMAVIGLLYEIGLPFVSLSDGRRFATQWELSNHLDHLFKKNQLEKTIASTEERGWYLSESVWSGESKTSEENKNEPGGSSENPIMTGTETDVDPSSFTMPAEEARDRCVICGINFKMFFDNDEGIYRYKNCKEMIVMMDDTAVNETEQMLVHVTCWRALGSPEVLDMDQVLERHTHR